MKKEQKLSKNNGCLLGCLLPIGLLFGLAFVGSLLPDSKKASNTQVTDNKPSKIVPPPSPVPAGWSATDEEGIYWRWCDTNMGCTTSKVIGDEGGYVLAQVWCKERACGDIYGRVNLVSESGVVVGWTNDTAYGDVGQVVQLTFDTYQDDWKKARLTELTFRK